MRCDGAGHSVERLGPWRPPLSPMWRYRLQQRLRRKSECPHGLGDRHGHQQSRRHDPGGEISRGLGGHPGWNARLCREFFHREPYGFRHRYRRQNADRHGFRGDESQWDRGGPGWQTCFCDKCGVQHGLKNRRAIQRGRGHGASGKLAFGGAMANTPMWRTPPPTRFRSSIRLPASCGMRSGSAAVPSPWS